VELAIEITAMREAQNSFFSDLMVSDKFDDFDVFSSIGIIYNNNDAYRSNGLSETNSTFTLCSFKESL